MECWNYCWGHLASLSRSLYIKILQWNPHLNISPWGYPQLTYSLSLFYLCFLMNIIFTFVNLFFWGIRSISTNSQLFLITNIATFTWLFPCPSHIHKLVKYILHLYCLMSLSAHLSEIGWFLGIDVSPSNESYFIPSLQSRKLLLDAKLYVWWLRMLVLTTLIALLYNVLTSLRSKYQGNSQ